MTGDNVRNDDGGGGASVSLDSGWTRLLSCGAKKIINPQIAASFPPQAIQAKYTYLVQLTCDAAQSNNMGILLLIFEANKPQRIWTKRSAKIVASSKFIRSSHVSCTLELECIPSGHCIIVACSEHTGIDMKFSVHISALDATIPREHLPKMHELQVHQRAEQGSWTKHLCDGYNKMKNPQIRIQVDSNDADIHIELHRQKDPKNGYSSGMAWLLYDSNGARGRILLKNKTALLAKSAFRSGSASVSNAFRVKHAGSYVAVLCLEKYSSDCEFSCIVTSSCGALLVERLPRCIVRLDGCWDSSNSFGVRSINGPQLALSLPSSFAAENAEAVISLRRTDVSSADMGVQLRVVGRSGGGDRHRRVVAIDDSSHVIAKSKFVLDTSVSCATKLLPKPHHYMIIPTLENPGAMGSFELEVEIDAAPLPKLDMAAAAALCMIEGEWTRSLSGGAHSIHNPQFVLQPPQYAHDIVIECSYKPKESEVEVKEGMRFVVYTSEHNDVPMLSSEQILPVAKSAFSRSLIAACHISMASFNPRPKYLIVVVQLGKPGLLGSFSLVAAADGKEAPSLTKLPEPHLIEIEGSWEGNTAAGYGSADNPQFEILIEEDSRVSAELVLDAANDSLKASEGICLSLYRGVQHMPGNRRKQLPKLACVGQSRYAVAWRAELSAFLGKAVATTYVMVPFAEHAGFSSSFRILLRSSVPLRIRELTTLANPSKRHDCKDILDLMTAIPAEERDSNHQLRGYYRACRLYKKNPLKKIVARCKELGVQFVDHEFMPSDASLNKDLSGTIGMVPKVSWARISEIRDEPQLFRGDSGRAIDPNDVVQGRVGDCWLLQAISSIASRGEILQRMLSSCEESMCGIYTVRLYDADTSSWGWIVLDDYLPVNERQRPAFAHSRDPDEIWVSLVEKAFAKLHSCYQFMKGSSPCSMRVDDALTLMTAGDSQNFKISEITSDDLWNKVHTHVEKHWVVGCGSKASGDPAKDGIPNEHGIVPNHAYSILGAVVVPRNGTEKRLLRLRNTWGRTEWTGRWSDASRHWNDESREKAGWMACDDGIFFMQLEDFIHNYHRVYLCRLTDDVYPSHHVLQGVLHYPQHQGFGSVSNPQVEIGMSLPGQARIELIVPRDAHPKLGKGLKLVVFEQRADDWGTPLSRWLQADIIKSTPSLKTDERAVSMEISMKRSTESRYVAIVILDRSRAIRWAKKRGVRAPKAILANVRFTLVVRSEHICRVQRLDLE